MVVVVVTIAFSARYLSFAHLEPRHTDLETVWVQFVGVILALSGVEAIANLTGVMKLDPGATPDRPKVTRTATKAILPVALEVVAGTALLGWAMLSMPKSYGSGARGTQRGHVTFSRPALRFADRRPSGSAGVRNFRWHRIRLLLVSAVNTAIVALIGVIYMMAQDGEMPRQFARLNKHGVPRIPLIVAVAIPILVLGS